MVASAAAGDPENCREVRGLQRKAQNVDGNKISPLSHGGPVVRKSGGYPAVTEEGWPLLPYQQ